MLGAIALAMAAPALAQTRSGQPNNAAQAAREKERQTNVPQQAEKQFPVGTSWVAISLNDKPYSGDRPGFALDAQYRARGFGMCNTYSATAYPLRDQGFAVGPLAMTKKDCGKQVMAAERAFLVALRTARKWDLVNGQLVLTGESGTLRFERVL
ncbi:META domain-containing protein [Chelatococcus daeguensis]|nr:META domain-containing protein [Chelatococcus daeguensis]